MKLFYAVTWEDVIDLGKHQDRDSAQDYAIDRYNVHQAKPGYLILDRTELRELVFHGQYAITHLAIPEGA